MVTKTTANYEEALLVYMKLAVETQKLIQPVPALRSHSIGEYVVGVELNEPFFKYKLKIGRSLMSLNDLKSLETSLQTRLVV